MGSVCCLAQEFPHHGCHRSGLLDSIFAKSTFPRICGRVIVTADEKGSGHERLVLNRIIQHDRDLAAAISPVGSATFSIERTSRGGFWAFISIASLCGKRCPLVENGSYGRTAIPSEPFFSISCRPAGRRCKVLILPLAVT
ncbi:hypothetical protein KCU88_g261, partial [Aureobasidium melanogenum]